MSHSSLFFFLNLLCYLFEILHNKILGGKKVTGKVFRDQIMLSLIKHKEFGLYPKMDRKSLKDFYQGKYDQVVFQKLSLTAV
jgi:hypothetical protein